MFFLHNWTSPVSKLVRFFITARVLFGTSPFSSQLAASCCEHVSLLFNWTHRVSNKSFFLRNWAPVSKTFHFFVTARALARNNSFFFATERVLFRTSVVWPQFDASGRNPGRELRNSGESAARSDDPSSPFSPRRPLNGGLVSQKRETSHFWDSMHKSSQTADFRVSERFHTRNGAHFRDALHNPRQKQAIENERKPNTSGLATPVPYRRTCGNTPNTRQRARF